MWHRLPVKDRMELMESYKRLGYDYNKMKDHFNKQFAEGGKVELTSGGEKHLVYEKESPTGNGKGIEGHIMVNHPTKDKGKWDTIDLTDITNYKVKTVGQGVASVKKWHEENPEYKYGGMQQFGSGGKTKKVEKPSPFASLNVQNDYLGRGLFEKAGVEKNPDGTYKSVTYKNSPLNTVSITGKMAPIRKFRPLEFTGRLQYNSGNQQKGMSGLNGQLGVSLGGDFLNKKIPKNDTNWRGSNIGGGIEFDQDGPSPYVEGRVADNYQFFKNKNWQIGGDAEMLNFHLNNKLNKIKWVGIGADFENKKSGLKFNVMGDIGSESQKLKNKDTYFKTGPEITFGLTKTFNQDPKHKKIGAGHQNVRFLEQGGLMQFGNGGTQLPTNGLNVHKGIPSEQNEDNSPLWWKGSRYPSRIQDEAKRDEAIKNYYWNVRDEGASPNDALRTLKENNSSYGSDRFTGTRPDYFENYHGFDYNDINDNKIKQFELEYNKHEYGGMQRFYPGGVSGPPVIDRSLIGVPVNPSETVNQPIKENPFEKAKVLRAQDKRQRLAYIEQERQRKADEDKTRLRVRAQRALDIKNKVPGKELYDEDYEVQNDIAQQKRLDELNHGTNEMMGNLALGMLPIGEIAQGAKLLGNAAGKEASFLANRWGNMAGNAFNASKESGLLSNANISNKLYNAKNQFSKALKGTGSTLNEITGELINGNENRKSIAEGNKWLNDWINHPETQNIIDEDIDNAIRKTNSSYLAKSGPSQYGVPSPYIKDLELIKNQSKNFKPNSREYSLSKQLDENLQQYLINSSRDAIHGDNWGVSYMHGIDPYNRALIESGVKSPGYRNGSYISRSRFIPQSKRASTVVHEGTHDWVSAKAFKQSGMRDISLENTNPEIKKDFLDWEHYRSIGKDPEKEMGGSRAHRAYLANPTEMHARIMELRKQLGVSPEYEFTPEYAKQIINWIDEGNSNIDPQFLDVIDEDPKKLATLFNKFWVATPLALAGAAALQQKKNK